MPHKAVRRLHSLLNAPLLWRCFYNFQSGAKYQSFIMSSCRQCYSGRSMPSLSAVKSEDLVDNPVKIMISGLKPGQKVTCHATLQDNKMRFGSYAHFLATSQGEVNVEDAASLGGTYTGADGMGLFWSMTQTPGQKSGLRLSKKDVTTPLTVNMSAFDGHLSADDLYQDSPDPLSTTTVNRWYLDKDVTRSEIHQGNIRGTLFTPPGKGPFKAVIDMFGTAGGIMEHRAALIASRGFLVLCLPFFNYQDLPKSLMDVDFSYFVEAVDWFSGLHNVQCGGIGVVGTSKGGEIGLWMAVHCPQVSSVVSISGNPFLGVCSMKYGSGELPGFGFDYSKLVKMKDGTPFRQTVTWDKGCFVPIQSSKAKVLTLFGDDDQMNPVEPQYEYIDWLPEGKRADVELCVYPGTGHLIEPPYSPFCRASFHILFRDSVLWGGEARAHSHSQVLAWRKLLEFLNQHVGESGQRTNTVTSQL